MRKVILSLAALLLCGAAASAADLRARPVVVKAPPLPFIATYSWSGAYAGLNGGFGWGRTNHTATIMVGAAGAVSSGDFDANGGLFGGTLGYNRQIGQYVVGLETDLDWASIKGTFAGRAAILGGTPFSLTSELKWLDTTRVRVGWASDKALFFVAGGAAFGGLTTTASANAALLGFAVAGTAGDTQTRFGWTLGGGVDYAFNDMFIGRLEYLYVDLGTQTHMLIDSVKFTTSIVRGGVDMKLN
jgi:outer membrane immunogenic protein